MRNRLKGIYELLLIGVGLAIIICFIFLNRKKNNARSTRMSCHTFFTLANIRLEQLGEFDESADLIIMNHQSVADILCLEAYHPRNICWVAKKQLGEIPFYGYALTGPEMILIDREDKRGLALLLGMVREKLAQKRPIVIFPEGTRSKGGERFLRFKPGAKIIAEKFNLKIQPIVLVNTRRIFNSSPLEATSNRARMIALKPFTLDEMPSKEVFYHSSDSLDRAKTLAHKQARKTRGLACIVDSGAESTESMSANQTTQPQQTATQESQQNLRQDSWYEQLEQCMQEVYTHHYNELNH